MSVLFELSRADIQCLLDYLPKGSDLRRVLTKVDATVFSNIQPPDFSNPVVCSEIDARRLLRLAEENCPAAIKKIEKGIRLSSLKSP